jgi:hypothetical protein
MSWTENGVLAIALHTEKKKRETIQSTQINKTKHTTLLNARNFFAIIQKKTAWNII